MSRHCVTCGREWDEQSAAYAQARETERHELAGAIRRTRYWVASWLVVLLAAASLAYLLWARP